MSKCKHAAAPEFATSATEAGSSSTGSPATTARAAKNVVRAVGLVGRLDGSLRVLHDQRWLIT